MPWFTKIPDHLDPISPPASINTESLLNDCFCTVRCIFCELKRHRPIFRSTHFCGKLVNTRIALNFISTLSSIGNKTFLFPTIKIMQQYFQVYHLKLVAQVERKK